MYNQPTWVDILDSGHYSSVYVSLWLKNSRQKMMVLSDHHSMYMIRQRGNYIYASTAICSYYDTKKNKFINDNGKKVKKTRMLKINKNESEKLITLFKKLTPNLNWKDYS
jgi:hypothetical protein